MQKFWLIKLISPIQFTSIYHNLGIRSYTDLVIHLWEMMTFDKRLGIQTSKIVSADKLDFEDKSVQDHAVRYRPSPVLCIRRSLQRLLTYLSKDQQQVFVDYGSGMGRVMIIAAQMGFNKVIGIELSSQLNEVCCTNTHLYSQKSPGSEFLILEKNAATFQPPKEACVFFFFSPFSQLIFDQVMEQIMCSVEEHPRPIFCLTLQVNYDFSAFGLSKFCEETGVSFYSNREITEFKNN